MLAATPPRRTTRSSTRNDSDTLCSWSGSNCSANRPGKCIRWSVAIEPVTAIFMATSGVRRGRPGQPTGRERQRPYPRSAGTAGCPFCGDYRSVERVAAGAGTRSVRVVDGEALGVDPVGEVDGGAGEVRHAHPVDDDLEAVVAGAAVAVDLAVVEEELVAQARAAAGLYRHPQPQVVAALLFEQRLDLLRGDVGEDHTGRVVRLSRNRLGGLRNGHDQCSLGGVH